MITSTPEVDAALWLLKIVALGETWPKELLPEFRAWLRDSENRTAFRALATKYKLAQKVIEHFSRTD